MKYNTSKIRFSGPMGNPRIKYNYYDCNNNWVCECDVSLYKILSYIENGHPEPNMRCFLNELIGKCVDLDLLLMRFYSEGFYNYGKI